MFNNMEHDVTLIVDQVGDLFSFAISFHQILEKKRRIWHFFDIT